MVMRDREQSDKLRRLASESTDSVPSPADARRTVLPHRRAPCFFTQTSTLVTSHFMKGWDEFPCGLLREDHGNDVHQILCQRGISTLPHEVTGGDPSVSPRWHFNLTMGGDLGKLIARFDPRGRGLGSGASIVSRARRCSTRRTRCSSSASRPTSLPGAVLRRGHRS